MDNAESQDHFEIEGLSRKDFLIEFYKPLQKRTLFIAGPTVAFLFLYWHIVFPSWQSSVLLGVAAGLVFSWYCGYKLAKQDKITASVYCYALAASIAGAMVILLLDGFTVAGLGAMFAGTMYAGLFERRPLYICAGINIGVPIFAELVKLYDIYPMLPVPPEYKLIPTAGMVMLTGLFVAYFILRSRDISGRMVRSLGVANKEQQEIITTIGNILPEINDAVLEIKLISTGVAFEANQLATATSEIARTMGNVKEIAVGTASIATESCRVAERTYKQSIENSEHLRSVETGFRKVMNMISEAAKEVTSLAFHMERIEEIFGFNRQIGEHITLLAINATIEADSAGAYDKVFGEIANEFKDLIRDTDENMTKSRNLLHAIRNQARESSLAIVNGSEQLTHYFEELRPALRTVEKNAKRFYSTAKQLDDITDAARGQQENVAEVSSAMAEIDQGCLDLRSSSRILEKNVTRIVTGQQMLSQVLDDSWSRRVS